MLVAVSTSKMYIATGCLNLFTSEKSKSLTANIMNSGEYALRNNNIAVNTFGFIFSLTVS